MLKYNWKIYCKRTKSSFRSIFVTILYAIMICSNAILPFCNSFFPPYHKNVMAMRIAKCLPFLFLFLELCFFLCVCEVTKEHLRIIQLNRACCKAKNTQLFILFRFIPPSPQSSSSSNFLFCFFRKCSFARIITLFSVIFALVVHLRFHFLLLAFDAWIIFHISTWMGAKKREDWQNETTCKLSRKWSQIEQRKENKTSYVKSNQRADESKKKKMKKRASIPRAHAVVYVRRKQIDEVRNFFLIKIYNVIAMAHSSCINKFISCALNI